jgi:hypothetical protein
MDKRNTPHIPRLLAKLLRHHRHKLRHRCRPGQSSTLPTPAFSVTGTESVASSKPSGKVKVVACLRVQKAPRTISWKLLRSRCQCYSDKLCEISICGQIDKLQFNSFSEDAPSSPSSASSWDVVPAFFLAPTNLPHPDAAPTHIALCECLCTRMVEDGRVVNAATRRRQNWHERGGVRSGRCSYH